MSNTKFEKLFDGIYKDKTVLLTGHTGFKGSWMCLWLRELGANVVGLSLNPPTEPSHFELLDLGVNSEICDIRDREKVSKIFHKYSPEVVIHMAAQPLVRYSYEKPVETYETNVIGTLNILESSRQCSTVKALVCITTDKCYQNNEWVWGYREDDRLGGHDPYSSSKACVEILTKSYRDSFFPISNFQNSHQTLIATVRAGNVIGGGDWAVDRLIPDIMRTIDNNEILHIRNPSATRPWQHVLDPLYGYLMIGQKMLEGDTEFAESWNFGPDDSSVMTVENVTNYIKEEWDSFKYTFDKTIEEVHEANLLKLDSSKARNVLKWKPVWNSQQTFKYTTEWYRRFFINNEVVSKQQLYKYVSLLNSTFQ